MVRMKFLALSTSVHRYTDSGIHTGMWLGEYTHFYDVITEAGHEVTLASVDGGAVPIEPENPGDPARRYQQTLRGPRVHGPAR